MQKFQGTSLDGMIKEIKEQEFSEKKGTLTMLLVDDNDNIVEAFKQTKDILPAVRDSLKEVAFYFNCIHAMTRVTLCNGM